MLTVNTILRSSKVQMGWLIHECIVVVVNFVYFLIQSPRAWIQLNAHLPLLHLLCSSSLHWSQLHCMIHNNTQALDTRPSCLPFGIESCWVCRLWWSFPCQRFFLFFGNSCIHWIHWIAVCFDFWQAYLLAHLKSVVTWITILLIFRLLNFRLYDEILAEEFLILSRESFYI